MDCVAQKIYAGVRQTSYLMNKLRRKAHIILFLALVGSVLVGCNVQSELNAVPQGADLKARAIDSQHPLAWVQSADPQLDAQQAIKDGDYRLLAFAGRVISMPGIDLAIYSLAELKQRCGYRVIRGTGDVVHSQKELPLRSQMHNYAVIYNQHMVNRCYAK